MEPHHHEHSHRLTSLNKAFIIGIALKYYFCHSRIRSRILL